MHAIKAPTDIRESEIADQSLVDAVAFHRGQRSVLGHYLAAVEEFKSSKPETVPLVAAQAVESDEELLRKNHRGVAAPAIRRGVVRAQSERALLRSSTGCAGGEPEQERDGKLSVP